MNSQTDIHTIGNEDRHSDRCTEQLERQTYDRPTVRQAYTQLEGQTDVRNTWKYKQMTDRQSHRCTVCWKGRQTVRQTYRRVGRTDT
jgi:hypothetical protein